MLPVSIPFVAPKQKEYVNDCLDRNWISAFGKYDDLLCKGFASFIGTKYASTCSNGTAALHLALLAVGVTSEDEVILPNFHAPYALFAVGYIAAKPVLVDVDKDWDVSISSLKKATTDKTKAIIIPHLYGVPSRLKPIKDYCKRNSIFIIEDCAEAHGSKEEDSYVGSLGDISCFSFYANKIIAAGEGGLCLTSDEGLLDKINYYKNQTFNLGLHKTFIHEHIGYNYRMSDLHCSIAYAHFEVIEEIISEREKILKQYILNLPQYSNCFQMKKNNVSNVNWVTTFRLPDDVAEKRDDLEVNLHENGIQSRRFFAPMCYQPIFKKMQGRVSEELINSINISKKGIYLPTYIGIKENDIKHVCTTINNFLRK